MGKRKHFLSSLDPLASLSNERLRSMHLDDSETEGFRTAAQKYLDKVIRRFSCESVADIADPRRSHDVNALVDPGEIGIEAKTN